MNNDEYTEEKRQHLEFIQNTIARMNGNSFHIRGLTITIVTALLAIYASTPKVAFIFLGIPPTLLFWFLDSYYLQQERKFRGIYDDVTGLKQVNQVKLYDMPIHKYTENKFSFWHVFRSKTIVNLYLPIIIFLILIGTLIHLNKL